MKALDQHFGVDLFGADQVEGDVGKDQDSVLSHAVAVVLFTVAGNLDYLVPLSLEHVVAYAFGDKIFKSVSGIHLKR